MGTTMAMITTMFAAEDALGCFEAEEVAGGSPTDILYVLLRRLFFFRGNNLHKIIILGNEI
jgi:hypothetical protein